MELTYGSWVVAQSMGKVDVPQEAFMAVLSMGGGEAD